METIEMIGTDAETEATCDGFEPCPFHRIEVDGDDWCTYCDQPGDDPQPVGCRCQGE